MGKSSIPLKSKHGGLLLLLVLTLMAAAACLVVLIRGFIQGEIPIVGVGATGLAICAAVLRVLTHQEKKRRKVEKSRR